MMQRPELGKWLRLMLVGGLLCLLVSETQAATREIQPLKEWRGRIERSLQQAALDQGYLTNQADLDRLRANWRIDGDKPTGWTARHSWCLVRTCNCSIISIAPCWTRPGRPGYPGDDDHGYQARRRLCHRS